MPHHPASGGVEQSDDLLRRVRELLERPNQRISPADPHVRERYLDSDLNTVVRIGRLPRQDVAVIRRLLPHELIQIRGQRTELVDADAVGRRMGLHQRPVFTGSVEIVEGPQKRWKIPSVVWLETFDSRLMSGRKPLYFFSSAVSPAASSGPRPFKVCLPDVNREVRVFFPDMAVSLGEPVSEKVQCTAQAVNDDASFCVDDTRDWFNLSEFPRIFAGLRIFLTDCGVWATIPPSSDPSVEDIELGFGPLNAGMNI